MSTQFRMRGGLPGAAARSAALRIAGELGLAPFIGSILVARGIDTPEAAREFLEPSLERDWRNPLEINGMVDAVDRIERAIRERDHIVVFGDFDLDGLSATTVMTRGIRALGGRVTPFIPRRFEEGYGITDAALNRLKQHEPDLIVTVDCGISCSDEVAQCVLDGIDVVVTDHHEAGVHVPIDVPVVDPKAEGDNPSAILAGVGVALKVIQALGCRFGYPHLWRSYTDFATLGTVADLMPMVDENRALVADGLRCMNEHPRPCIAALMAASDMSGKELTSTNLSFSLVPRLNAAGRMGEAEAALDLLMCDGFEEASTFAMRLDEMNSRRREIESELSDIAQVAAKAEYAGERVIVVAGRGWHEGVKGIVASRLVGIYGVPALLFTIEGDEARGSGRSVGNVNLFKAIESTSDLLTRFGGHGAAVGVTLPIDNLPEFKRRLDEYLQMLPAEDFCPMVDVDALVSLDELTLDSVRQLSVLAPFGQEMPEPVMLAHNVVLDQCRAVGADKTHLSCKLTDGRRQTSAILFHAKDIEELIACEAIVDAAFTAQIDEWRGVESVKAMLKAVVPARACCGLAACSNPDACRFIDELYTHPHDDAPDAAPSQDEGIRFKWEKLYREDPAALEREVVSAIIGDRLPHETQRAILERLRAGESILGVMATGRGKSLVFQVSAGMLAIAKHEASLFVYPLRALMHDQAYRLSCQFERFGLACRVLNGDTAEDDRAETYQGLKDGTVDIVLTTPEYLAFHASRIAECKRIGFMVIDEAHHIGQSKAGQRPAYKNLGEVAAKLGSPVVLAVTATADDDFARQIGETLLLSGSIVDETARENLHIDDARGIPGRDEYLAHIAATGDKCIIYVNSREHSVGVARRLRARLPQLATMIGFYNAGLRRNERSRVEDLFRSGEMRTLVATSAFGEGIDIPDIRHVVLYHMPFSDVEFNQMAGRCGRDGEDAWVHLLYGYQDVQINRGILENMTPNRDVMAQVYRRMRALQREATSAHEAFFSMGIDELARLSGDAVHPVSEQAVACGIAVFRELGLIEAKRTYNSGEEKIQIRVIEGAPHVELTDSVRYREGQQLISSFMEFRDWAVKCDLQGLTVRVTHPIAPMWRRLV